MYIPRRLAGMTALQDDELQFKPVAVWSLPADRAGFLDWLAKSGIPGTQPQRLETFLNVSSAARLMPEALLADLRENPPD